jgi:hypothetical protein
MKSPFERVSASTFGCWMFSCVSTLILEPLLESSSFAAHFRRKTMCTHRRGSRKLILCGSSVVYVHDVVLGLSEALTAISYHSLGIRE